MHREVGGHGEKNLIVQEPTIGNTIGDLEEYPFSLTPSFSFSPLPFHFSSSFPVFFSFSRLFYFFSSLPPSLPPSCMPADRRASGHPMPPPGEGGREGGWCANDCGVDGSAGWGPRYCCAAVAIHAFLLVSAGMGGRQERHHWMVFWR